MPEDRTLAQAFRRFADAAAVTSPVHERVARAISESGEALRAVQAAPVRRRQPGLVLACLHDLALAGRAPALAAALVAADRDAAAAEAVALLVQSTDSVVALAVRHQVQSDETGRYAVLYPAIAEAAHRTGADVVGLVDVGRPAGLNLLVDRVGISYSTGETLGDPSSPVQVSASVVGNRPPPARVLPEVRTRVSVGSDPIDVTDAEEARWLRACLPPDRDGDIRRLEAELALASATPPMLVDGDPLELLPEALARVPADALPIVLTTWTLSRLGPERRPRFLERLREAAAGRVTAWVSAEGVGVAPAVPTLGDRHASGHSILGLAVVDRSLHVEAVGRCWSRGNALAWLAAP